MLHLQGLLCGLLISALLLPGASLAQSAADLPTPPLPQQGMATGVRQGAQFDDQHRPITAGGFVDSGPIIFEDITKKAGLSLWSHKMGTPAKKYIIEADGSGVALIDTNNDGWLDIYLVNGSTFDAQDGKVAGRVTQHRGAGLSGSAR